ncbi:MULTISPECIES: aspartyl-phosphate phosphatase Spo0E family protein [Bacillaceae]|uniref:Aspartyl-phosphate phosphatase Spo0E family protein n=2 Tax=Bacillales TaxID=1385 RepID=A0A177KWP3_9BACI|nr:MULTISPECIES: aspartyl-phosphate phosphatase Spo0E family protein [Bacillaceae]OAH57779.1 hypothetical protein AWH48_01805 [Domibacillus aminovorans]
MPLIDIVAWIISIVLFISFIFSLVTLLSKPRLLRETEMLSTQLNLDDLSTQINDIRELMIASGLKKGFTDIETLKYSEELDKLILQFQLQSRL